jgi:hypothetical protein
VEVFGCGETAEEGEAFGDYTYLPLDVHRVLGGVEAEDVNGAGGGSEQAGEHLDGGGFACAVGAEEAEELTRGYGEVDVLNGGEVAEAAGETGGGDGGDHVREAYLKGKGPFRENFRRKRLWVSANPLSEPILFTSTNSFTSAYSGGRRALLFIRGESEEALR